jgi:NADP-dependent 3-hydroxy acid dehydrogenase YdfG
VAHYTAAKHAVVGLIRSLAKELAPHNIRVNTVPDQRRHADDSEQPCPRGVPA